MYENVTYETILNRMLSRISSQYDIREGSIIYDALAPAAVELKQMYMEMDNYLNETFADTASREYLIKRAAERGLIPIPASYSTVIGSFLPTTIEIPIGSRFSCEDLNFIVTSKIQNGRYYMQCETPGDEGNISSGTLLMIDNINGLISGEIVNISIYGADEEETETFRNRYFASLLSDAFGGNKIDYNNKALSQAGVGGVKVFGSQEWNGAGSVKLVVQSSVHGVPSVELINQLQTTFDPVANMGMGNGIAPIGHIVTISPVSELTVNVTINLSYEQGYDWNAVELLVKNTIDNYFNELNSTWDDYDNIIVRIAQIESRVLELDGILDVSNATLNGRAENLLVDSESIIVKGTVNDG